MKARIVSMLTVVAGLGAMCAAGQTGPSATRSDAPTTMPVATAPATATLPPTGEDLRKRVVVDAFGYSTVIPAVQLIFNPYVAHPKKNQPAPATPNIGRGIQSMLIQRLAEGGKVVVVDKDRLEEIKKMQEEGVSIRNQPGKGAGLGRIRTADLLLVGDIVVFGRDDKGGALAAAAALPWPYSGLGALNKKEDKAVVKVSYRLLDAETDEVVKTGDAEGHSIRKSRGISGLAGTYGGGGGMILDMSNSNFAETIIGEATVDCVKNLAGVLNDQLAKMKHRVREVEGTVAEVSGNTLYLATGSNDGVNVGDVFEIDKSMGDVKDPLTGEVLYKKTEKKGEMTVTEVHDKIAIGTYVGTPAEPKDIARRKTAAGEQK